MNDAYMQKPYKVQSHCWASDYNRVY